MFGIFRIVSSRTLKVSEKNFVQFYGKRDFNNLIRVDDSDGVRKITMIDVKTRNSLSLAMVASLRKAIEEKLNDQSLRCIVLSAEGGNVFSAGHNLKELATAEGKEVFKSFSKLMLSMVQSPVPIISAVDGLAAAAGCQLVAQTDFILCTKRSSFSTPGANFGIFCSTPGVAVARAVPQKVAAYMLFTGYPLSSEEAFQVGLVQKVVNNKDDLDAEVKSATDAITAKSRSVVELGKKVFYSQINMNLKDAYDVGTKAMLENLELPDGREGINSFAEKRKPVWKH